MRSRRCTIDSSCIIALDHLQLVPQLSVLFSPVLVPKAVRKELFKRRATKDRLQFIFSTYGFFQRCDGYDQGTVDFLLAERARLGVKDRGEVEAVVQASQLGAAVIIDDPWGRDLATRADLDFHGTVWVLQQLYQLGLLSPTLGNCFALLRDRGVRLPWETVNELLVSIGEEPLKT
jgi:predicted nucleic acid-binding protein